MSLIIDLIIKNPGRYAFDKQRLFGVVKQVLFNESGRWSKEEKIVVSLLVSNKKLMTEFNWRYHQTKGPTDVLSFPYTDHESQVSDIEFVTPPDTGIVLGDLIVCYPVAREVALREGKTTQEKLEFYVEHGMQHLLGHHHD